MKDKKQRHLINNLINSPDLLGQCIDILEPEYFEPNLVPDVRFLIDYHLTNNCNPTISLMNAESINDITYNEYNVPVDEIEYSATEIEAFCKQSAMREAILDSYELIQEEKFGEIYKKVSDALEVSIKKDLGLDVFEDPKKILTGLLEEHEHIPCGIKALDNIMGGGTLRKQFMMLSANSGGGKSVMLSNLANNYALQGLDVCYISFELPEDMIFLRQAFIMTSFSHRVWKDKILEISEAMTSFKKYGAGDFRIVRMPVGSTANTVRSYIKQYEIENNKAPDVLILDYLDLMRPISGIKNKNISEQDREKSQEVYEILNAYDMIGWSASQQNRDALKMSSPDHSAIAGGMSKVDICDYWISLFMDGSMRLEGNMLAYFLKARYSDGHGEKVLLSFDNSSLKISTHDKPDKVEDLLKNIGQHDKKGGKDSLEKEIIHKMVDAGDLELPGLENTGNSITSSKIDAMRDAIVDFTDEDVEDGGLLELTNLMNNLQMK